MSQISLQYYLRTVFFLDRLTGPWGPVIRIEKNEKDRLDKMKISNHKWKFEIDDHDFDLMKFWDEFLWKFNDPSHSIKFWLKFRGVFEIFSRIEKKNIY